jgi:hypothetical protein
MKESKAFSLFLYGFNQNEHPFYEKTPYPQAVEGDCSHAQAENCPKLY